MARDNTIGAVYGWMAAGLCLTALVSMAIVSSPALFTMLFGNWAVFFGLFIVELGLVFAISGFALRMGAAIAAPLFLLYSALNGVTLSHVACRVGEVIPEMICTATFGISDRRDTRNS